MDRSLGGFAKKRMGLLPRVFRLFIFGEVLWRLQGETMNNLGSWRGTLFVVFAIGAGWIGWPLYGLITLAAAQSSPPNRPQAHAVVQDPHCPGNDNHALMCRLVNEYRAKHSLKPVQLDDAVTREAQYWSDQLDRQSACWFLYHDDNYHVRMRARFPGRRFRENAACSGSTGGGAGFILRKWIDSSGHRENMLTPEWKTIGVGVTRNIWVIDFTN
jgi:Cysteine-rich secretory protein family